MISSDKRKPVLFCIILSAVLAVGAVIVNKVSGNAFMYQLKSNSKQENNYNDRLYSFENIDTRVTFPLEFEYGISEEYFGILYPRYTVSQRYEEYSAIIPEGCIIRAENADNDDTAEVYISKGAENGAVCDYQNLIDPEEYFSENPDDLKVSHNEFYSADGQLNTVDILCEYIDTVSIMGETKTVYKGEPEVYITSGGKEQHCLNASGSESTLSDPPEFFYEERFSLKLDDYNNDGYPDFCFRVSSAGSEGSFYRMVLNNMYRKHNGVSCINEAFLICNESDCSVKLDRINMDTYYFFTKDYQTAEYKYAAFNSDGSPVDIEPYINNGMIFSSYYENGQLSLTCENTLTEDNAVLASFELKRLDGYVWRNTDIALEGSSFALSANEEKTICFDEPLSGEIYKIIISADGICTETEFRVI